jgi:2-haloacid dehalogenase
MPTDRRSFLAGVGALAAASAASAQTTSRASGQAVAFDGFPIIDARPVGVKAERLFPGRGEALLNAWRTRQFEYTWLRTLSDTYADFWQTTQDALAFAARSIELPLDADARDGLMQTYLELKAWDDVRPALEALRNAGFRLVLLSNFTARMLDAAVQNSGLQGFFEPHLTTDRVRAYKPAPHAYAMATKALRLPKENVMFCAAAGWDAAGAKAFGYRTFWVNRMKQPAEELGVKADAEGAGLGDLVRFALAS